MIDSHYVLVCKTSELLLKISTLTDRQTDRQHMTLCNLASAYPDYLLPFLAFSAQLYIIIILNLRLPESHPCLKYSIQTKTG